MATSRQAEASAVNQSGNLIQVGYGTTRPSNESIHAVGTSATVPRCTQWSVLQSLRALWSEGSRCS
eukprot:3319458-Pyramimonas_sp.AAC.1